MRSLLIVMVTEHLQSYLRFGHRGKDVHLQTFITHGAIKSLLFAILPGTTGINVEGANVLMSAPGVHCDRDKCRSIITAKIRHHCEDTPQHHRMPQALPDDE